MYYSQRLGQPQSEDVAGMQAVRSSICPSGLKFRSFHGPPAPRTHLQAGKMPLQAARVVLGSLCTTAAPCGLLLGIYRPTCWASACSVQELAFADTALAAPSWGTVAVAMQAANLSYT